MNHYPTEEDRQGLLRGLRIALPAGVAVWAVIILAALALAGCGTSASMSYRADDVELVLDLNDYKDREAIQIDVQRDAATGRVTGFSLQSTNSLTSPVAELNAQATLQGLELLNRLAATARPTP